MHLGSLTSWDEKDPDNMRLRPCARPSVRVVTPASPRSRVSFIHCDCFLVFVVVVSVQLSWDVYFFFNALINQIICSSAQTITKMVRKLQTLRTRPRDQEVDIIRAALHLTSRGTCKGSQEMTSRLSYVFYKRRWPDSILKGSFCFSMNILPDRWC